MAQNIVKVIECDGEPEIEIEQVGDFLILWQDNNQPCMDRLSLNPAMQRQLRDFLNQQVKDDNG